MIITPKMIQFFIDSYGGLSDFQGSLAVQLAIDLAKLSENDNQRRQFNAEILAEHKRHNEVLDAIEAKREALQSTCPHPALEPHTDYWECPVCGWRDDDEPAFDRT